MKPIGLRPAHIKKDHHIHCKHRKVPNWWETEQEIHKTQAKVTARKELQLEMEE